MSRYTSRDLEIEKLQKEIARYRKALVKIQNDFLCSEGCSGSDENDECFDQNCERGIAYEALKDE